MGTHATHDERGITLLELMIAMILLTIALVGLAAAFPLAMFGVVDGGLQSIAVALAEAPIEKAKRIPYADMANLTTATPPGIAEARACVSVASPCDFAGFEREVLVASYTPAGCGGAPCNVSCVATPCQQVEVRVYFTGQQGEVRTTFTTIVSQ